MTEVATPTDRGVQRTFWTYWSATTISSMGSAVAIVAVPLVAVLLLDATVFEASLLTAASYVGWLVLGLPAGVIVQRRPLRQIQVAMDVIRLVSQLSLPIAWWLGHLTFLHLLLATLVTGLATILFDVANATFLPRIIPKDELTSRNSFVSGTHAVTQSGGPSLGGLLVQVVGPATSLVADAVSYALSAVLLLRLPESTPVTDTSAPTSSMRASIAEGWRFVRHHPVMFPSMLWATATNFACGALFALMPVYLVRDLDLSAAVVGLMIAADGVGTLLGSIVTPRLVRRLGSARAMVLASLGGAALSLTMALASPSTAWLFAIGNAGYAVGVVVGSVVTRTHRQVESPPDLLSRVMATVRFMSWGAPLVGALGAGALATVLSTHAALWAACAATFIAPVILLLSPVRGLRNLSETDAG